MAVNMSTLIESFKNEISPPGTDLYPTVQNAQYLSRLKDAFWEAKLNRAFPLYTLSGDNIVPISGTTDLPREQQQLIVLYAGFRVVLTAFQNLSTQFRAKAGPVEYDTQKSATMLKSLLDALRARIKQAIDDSTGASSHLALVLDGLIDRSWAIYDGDVWYAR